MPVFIFDKSHKKSWVVVTNHPLTLFFLFSLKITLTRISSVREIQLFETPFSNHAFLMSHWGSIRALTEPLHNMPTNDGWRQILSSVQLVFLWIPWEMDTTLSFNTEDLDLLCQIVGIENNNSQPNNQSLQEANSSTTASENVSLLPEVTEV